MQTTPFDMKPPLPPTPQHTPLCAPLQQHAARWQVYVLLMLVILFNLLISILADRCCCSVVVMGVGIEGL